MADYKHYHLRLKKTDRQGPVRQKVHFEIGNAETFDVRIDDPKNVAFPEKIVKLNDREYADFKGNTDWEVSAASEAQVEAIASPNSKGLASPVKSKKSAPVAPVVDAPNP